MMSIAFVRLVLGPGMLSITRYALTAISFSFSDPFQKLTIADGRIVLTWVQIGRGMVTSLRQADQPPAEEKL
jgi:hypothetical protein